MRQLKFAIIGGDKRQAAAAARFAANGHRAAVFALDAGVESASTLQAAVAGADCVVLPLPMMRTAGLLHTPQYNEGLALDELFAALRTEQMICGGVIDATVHQKAARHGLRLVDYYAREELIISGAVATAEGAVQIAMEKTPVMLTGSHCLVIGFGRIGKILAHRLRALGAQVSVSARKSADLAWIAAYGYTPMHTNALDGALQGFDVLFNTVPHLVLDDTRTAQLDSKTLCIDLASAPGGIDLAAAARRGLETVWALGLPGKVAPETSGNAICDTIYNILREEGKLE